MWANFGNEKDFLVRLRDTPRHGSGHTVAFNSATGTRTRVARVRAEYPNQLDYSGRGGNKKIRHRVTSLIGYRKV